MGHYGCYSLGFQFGPFSKLVLGLFSKQNQWQIYSYVHVCVCVYLYVYIDMHNVCIHIYIYQEIYHKELAYEIMEADKSHDLQGE